VLVYIYIFCYSITNFVYFQIIRNADLEELTELGSGTYGTVYHGKWRGTDIAIKRIKKSCFAGRSSEQERLVSIQCISFLNNFVMLNDINIYISIYSYV